MDLKNTKIWVGDDHRLCKAAQKRIFEMGYEWNGGGTKIENTNATLLYIRESGRMVFSTDGKEKLNENDGYTEIFPIDLGILIDPKEPVMCETEGKDPETVSNELKELLCQIKSL